MRLLPIEWAALGFAVVLLGLTFLSDPLYRESWFMGDLIKSIVWIVASLIAIFSVGWAFDGYGHPLRRGVVMPLALLTVLFLSGWVFGLGRWTFARLELQRNQQWLETEAARRPGTPIALRYIDGIPDGGVAIIRSTGEPRRLSAREQIALVGEDINHCSRLKESYFARSFD